MKTIRKSLKKITDEELDKILYQTGYSNMGINRLLSIRILTFASFILGRAIFIKDLLIVIVSVFIILLISVDFKKECKK